MTVTRDVLHAPEPDGRGKSVDVYCPGTGSSPTPTVLLWHGTGPDERDVLGPLAKAVAREGVLVFVPDWRSDVSDAGRAHLLASLRFVRDRADSYGGDADRTVLAGWSAGAGAAMGIALRPELVDGWRPAGVVGIAGRYDLPARTTGADPLSDLVRTSAAPLPVRLVHGASDAVLSHEHSRQFHRALHKYGWPAELAEPATDHAGVIMATFDPRRGRCVPAQSEHALQAGRETARIIAQAAVHGSPAAPRTAL
ncbi:alpha/beta hydrolase [Streptomyces sp. H27-D2]|uniref:alpha/beta hydrolase n=1 Tax=Streptomyces sp. H27-D2 TaxID=3046304 RepID=UPI002DBF8BCA|nr:alpha/beta hydrolase fold domain-containing protein [Streptomyces sp. H27-D2]MEC4020847.1 alpha/beta hydrolase fold domain-containing protein [Streptomyces sp. H27-D2]